MLIYVPGSATVLLEGSPIEVGDIMSLFHDSSGVKFENHVFPWNPPFNSNNIANENWTHPSVPTAKLGYDDNEFLHFKVTDVSRNCVMEPLDFFMKSGILTYQRNRNDTLVSWIGQNSSISYPTTTVCNSRLLPVVPVLSGAIANLWFSNNTGLAVDSLTGAVSAVNSTPGMHWIRFNTITCLDQDSVQFEILPNTGSVDLPLLTYCQNDTNVYAPTVTNAGTGLQFKTLSTTFLLNNTSGEFKPSENDLGTHDIFIESSNCLENSNLEIKIINVSGDIIHPISEPLCNTRTDTITPAVSGIISNLKSRSTLGLAIDSITGGIIPDQSSVGMHTIYYETPSCLNVDSLNIQIDPASTGVSPGRPSFCFFDDNVYEADFSGSPNTKFKSLNPLFTVDSTNGGFKPSDGPVGTHTVRVESDD